VRNFLWRYWYAGNRALLVVAAILVALLLIRRLRVYRALTVAALIGGIVVAGWLLISPLLVPTPLVIIHEGGVVKNAAAATAACGTERDALAVLNHIPEPSMSTWGTEPKGTCVVRYHHRPPERW
jgi:hypothetical protein